MRKTKEARIVSIKKEGKGFSGVGKWSDGEEFIFKSDDSLTQIELWALNVLINRKN